MTTQSILRSFVALCLIVFGTQWASAQIRHLRTGEPILLEIIDNPTISTAEVGNVVDFKTSSNVIINGKEVIRAGAPARGRIKYIERPGYNTTGLLKIEIDYVRAIDGQQVLVFSPNNLSNWSVGTAMTVNVKNDYRIDVP